MKLLKNLCNNYNLLNFYRLVSPALLMIIVVYFLSSIFDLYTFYFDDYNNFKLIFTIFISLFSIFYCIKRIVVSFFRKKVISILSYLLIIPAVFLIPNIIFFEKISKIFVFHGYYKSCIEKGAAFGIGQVFSVCDIHSWGYLEGVEQFYAVIYDSSDYIICNNKRTDDWRIAVMKYSNKIPFGSFHFNVTKIINHYYIVDFGSEGLASLSLSLDF